METTRTIKRLKSIESLVHGYLTAHAVLRDNFMQLTTNVWYSQMRGLGYTPESMNTSAFLDLYQQGKLSSEETIQRCRRKLQERHAELRGERWEERKAEEDRVRHQINENDNYESKFRQLNIFDQPL